MDSKLPDLLKTQSIIEKWIKDSKTPEQLFVCNELIPDFFNPRRFPSEQSNAIYLAKVSLFLAVEERMNDLNLVIA